MLEVGREDIEEARKGTNVPSPTNQVLLQLINGRRVVAPHTPSVPLILEC